LSLAEKAKLLSRLPVRRTVETTPTTELAARLPLGDTESLAHIALMRDAAPILGIESPYYRVHSGLAGAFTEVDGRSLSNFVSYNYLGLNGDPRVIEAAKSAIDRYGTSVSASRLVSGERPIHRELEQALAELYEAEDCLTFVSGHATNVTAVGCLVGRDDAVIHDALAHNSIVQGAILSGAKRLSFPHNNLQELERLLIGLKGTAKRILVIVEGHYSMDGDVVDLSRLAGLTRAHGAYLMVDEAHSLGVLGSKGHGIAEHCGVEPGLVDLWMGTLSKTLCGCGGYIAGSRAIVDYLRCAAPGFVYSVGLSPPLAAAALAALRIMQAEPERVARLRTNATYFLNAAKEAGLDTGSSIGAAIISILTGSSIVAARAADSLFKQGLNVQPILAPAVPERSARLRFFVTSLHDEAQIRDAVAMTAEAVAGSSKRPGEIAAIAAALVGGTN
jgi:8-amino-7-oxononanoate synthase